MAQPADGLQRHHLDLAARRGPEVLVATALRTRSVRIRDLFAAAATDGRLTYDDLARLALERPEGLEGVVTDAGWASMLARVVSLQRVRSTDLDVARRVFLLVEQRFGMGRMVAADQRAFVETLLELRDDAARRVLGHADEIPPPVKRYLELDLDNPFRTRSPRGVPAWLEGVNDRFFPTHERVSLVGEAEHPFDRLRSTATTPVDEEPLVTVIVTTYRPDEGLVTAVSSLVAQSWRNLEILVVDDASSEEYVAVLERCVAIDPRVRLLRLPHNGGTYLARNAGLDAAAGEVVTFQDADDWSHPRRIELQTRALLDDASLPATRSWAVRASDDLVFYRFAQEPERPIASSLMFRRREALERIGYFDSVRKAGDTEYHRRLELAYGRRALDLRDVLSVVRMRGGSLSRSDFLPGWHHPARYSYRIAYEHWQTAVSAAGGSLWLPPRTAHRPFPAPPRWAPDGGPGRSLRYDVVVVADWRHSGQSQRSALAEIRELTSRGLRVGITQMETVEAMVRGRLPLALEVQDVVNAGVVDHVLLDDPVEVGLVLVRHPPVLQFPPEARASWQVGQAWVLANVTPTYGEGRARRYRVDECDDAVRQLLAVRPTWVPQSPVVRRALAREAGDVRVAPFDLPPIVDTHGWEVHRRRPYTQTPVLGRLAGSARSWPATRAEVRAAYPRFPSADVRVLGDLRPLRRKLGRSWNPGDWLVYQVGEVPLRSFLAQLDFYVYLPEQAWTEASCRDVLDALAAGCVAVLPEPLRELFGDAAVYETPEDVVPTVTEMHGSARAFLDQSERGRQFVRDRHRPSSFSDSVVAALGQPPGHTMVAAVPTTARESAP